MILIMQVKPLYRVKQQLHIGHKQRYSHIIDLIVMHKNNKYQMPAELKVALVGAKGVGKVPVFALFIYICDSILCTYYRI